MLKWVFENIRIFLDADSAVAQGYGGQVRSKVQLQISQINTPDYNIRGQADLFYRWERWERGEVLVSFVFSAKFFLNSSFAPGFLYQKAVKQGTILLVVLS